MTLIYQEIVLSLRDNLPNKRQMTRQGDHGSLSNYRRAGRAETGLMTLEFSLMIHVWPVPVSR